MNLSNSNELINFETKKLEFWNEMRKKMKNKWFVCKKWDMKI